MGLGVNIGINPQGNGCLDLQFTGHLIKPFQLGRGFDIKTVYANF